MSHTRLTEPAPADAGIPTSLIRRCRRAGGADDDQSVPERAPPNHERTLPPIAGFAGTLTTTRMYSAALITVIDAAYRALLLIPYDGRHR